MRAVTLAALGLMVAAGPAAAAADTVFSYRGKLLMPKTGNGVPGVTILRFRLSGPMPDKGACAKNLTILDVSDGAYSLKKLLALGFTMTSGSRAEICSDAITGALSEKLRVQLVQEYNGSLQASYTWKSADPATGRMPDTVRLFANVEYHVSASASAGRIRIQ